MYISGIGDEVLFGLCLALALVYIVYNLMVQYLPNLYQPHANQNNEDMTSSGRVRSNAQDCSICLGEATYAIETNCGHVYCAMCILSYYEMTTPVTQSNSVCLLVSCLFTFFVLD